jgi:hypothetical protein
MHGLMPLLAHGALGSLDEILALVLIGGLAVVFVVVGFMSRREEADLPAQPDQPATGEQNESTAADHYRLD